MVWRDNFFDNLIRINRFTHIKHNYQPNDVKAPLNKRPKAEVKALFGISKKCHGLKKIPQMITVDWISLS